MRSRQRQRGGVLPLVLIILVVAIGAGGFNYWRNLQLEEQVPRPYGSYSDRQIEELIGAYRSEVERLDASYAQARDSRSVRQAAAGAHISEQLEAYERARRSGDTVRSRAADAAQQEAVLRELLVEQQLRSVQGAGLTVHWNRLTTLP